MYKHSKLEMKESLEKIYHNLFLNTQFEQIQIEVINQISQIQMHVDSNKYVIELIADLVQQTSDSYVCYYKQLNQTGKMLDIYLSNFGSLLAFINGHSSERNRKAQLIEHNFTNLIDALQSQIFPGIKEDMDLLMLSLDKLL